METSLFTKFGTDWEHIPEFDASSPSDHIWSDIEDIFEAGAYGREKPMLINIVKPDNEIMGIRIHHIEKTSRQIFCTVMMNEKKIMFEY